MTAIVARYGTAQQTATASLKSRVKYYKELGDEDDKKIELAAATVAVERTALIFRKESVRERGRGCRCSVGQYMERFFRF